jgi:hypothetical protein
MTDTDAAWQRRGQSGAMTCLSRTGVSDGPRGRQSARRREDNEQGAGWAIRPSVEVER